MADQLGKPAASGNNPRHSTTMVPVQRPGCRPGILCVPKISGIAFSRRGARFEAVHTESNVPDSASLPFIDIQVVKASRRLRLKNVYKASRKNFLVAFKV